MKLTGAEGVRVSGERSAVPKISLLSTNDTAKCALDQKKENLIRLPKEKMRVRPESKSSVELAETSWAKKNPKNLRPNREALQFLKWPLEVGSKPMVSSVLLQNSDFPISSSSASPCPLKSEFQARNSEFTIQYGCLLHQY